MTIQEPEVPAEAISPAVIESQPLEPALAEDIEAEEPIEFPPIPEAPPEAPEQKQIRFAEDILLAALRAGTTDKDRSGVKKRRGGKVTKRGKEDDHLVHDEMEE